MTLYLTSTYKSLEALCVRLATRENRHSETVSVLLLHITVWLFSTEKLTQAILSLLVLNVHGEFSRKKKTSACVQPLSFATLRQLLWNTAQTSLTYLCDLYVFDDSSHPKKFPWVSALNGISCTVAQGLSVAVSHFPWYPTGSERGRRRNARVVPLFPSPIVLHRIKMVVIGACITSRVRPLLARQFVDIRRAKVEGLLNAFVKLVDYSGAHLSFSEYELGRKAYRKDPGQGRACTSLRGLLTKGRCIDSWALGRVHRA